LGIKKNEITPFAGKWMELEIIIMSEISQTQKAKYHVLLIFESRSKIVKITIMGLECKRDTVGWEGQQIGKEKWRG
jgi:hypothetical protein